MDLGPVIVRDTETVVGEETIVGAVYYDSSEPRVNVHGKVFIPRRFELHTTAGSSTVAVTFVVVDKVPRPSEIHILGEDPVGAFSTVKSSVAVWGELSTRALMRSETKSFAIEAPGLGGVLVSEDDGEPGGMFLVGQPRQHEVKDAEKAIDGRRKLSDEFLAEVAASYRRHGGRHAAIAEELGCSTRNANKYIWTARKRGLLPPTKQGKASK
jgi:hypothetical protein